jgi:hypothetical protein
MKCMRQMVVGVLIIGSMSYSHGYGMQRDDCAAVARSCARTCGQSMAVTARGLARLAVAVWARIPKGVKLEKKA